MNTRLFFVSTLLAVLVLIFLSGPMAEAKKDDVDYGSKAKMLPTDEQIFSWIKDLWWIGRTSETGFRRAGTEADHRAANYILEKFKSFGLHDVHLEPVKFPSWAAHEWGLKIKVGENQRWDHIPSYYRPYSGFTPAEGLTAEMVYVGRGMKPADFKGVKNKIVVVDLFAPGLPFDKVFKPAALFVYDPDNTLPGAKVTQNWPVLNILSSFKLAVENGAVGFVGILDFDLQNMNQYYSPYNAILQKIPGIYISRLDGKYLKKLIKENPVKANLVLRGSKSEGTTHNVVGSLPGQTNEVILVTSHLDGWAVNDASGTSIVMALAKYCGQLPAKSTKKTLMFVASAGHFIGDIPTRAFIKKHSDMMPSVVVDLNIEHIAKEIVEKDGMFRWTGLVAPRAFFISGPRLSGNKYLTAIAKKAVIKNKLKRTVGTPASGLLGPHPPGISHWYDAAGIPIVHLITGPAVMFTPVDTPDKVASDQLRRVTATFVDIIDQIDNTPADLMKTKKEATSGSSK